MTASRKPSSSRKVIEFDNILFSLSTPQPLHPACKSQCNEWGEWPSGLYSLLQVTEVKLGRVRSDAGWVTLGV